MTSIHEVRALALAATEKITVAIFAQQQSAQAITATKTELNVAAAEAHKGVASHLTTISNLRDALGQAQAALTGSTNTNIQQAVAWIEKVLQDVEDDIHKFLNLEDKIKEDSTILNGVQTNVEEGIKHLQGAVSHITAGVNKL
jgi:uncharacterized phage infection (PIP) family protein YhgE